MVICTKYYCDNCSKEVKEYSDLGTTWYGNNAPHYSSFKIFSFDTGLNKKELEPFPRFEIGNLCKLCFEDCKSRIKAWKEDNNLKHEVQEC